MSIKSLCYLYFRGVCACQNHIGHKKLSDDDCFSPCVSGRIGCGGPYAASVYSFKGHIGIGIIATGSHSNIVRLRWNTVFYQSSHTFEFANLGKITSINLVCKFHWSFDCYFRWSEILLWIVTWNIYFHAAVYIHMVHCWIILLRAGYNLLLYWIYFDLQIWTNVEETHMTATTCRPTVWTQLWATGVSADWASGTLTERTV